MFARGKKKRLTDSVQFRLTRFTLALGLFSMSPTFSFHDCVTVEHQCIVVGDDNLISDATYLKAVTNV